MPVLDVQQVPAEKVENTAIKMQCTKRKLLKVLSMRT